MFSFFQTCLTLLLKRISLLQNFPWGQECYVHLQFTWLTIIMISLFRWRKTRVWGSWLTWWWGARTGGSVPEKEKYRSKPVALCRHAGSPSRVGQRKGHPPRASPRQNTRLQWTEVHRVGNRVESAGRLWLFRNKNLSSNLVYPQPSYGGGRSSCSSDFH